jgi:hypothetical protein
LKTGNFETVLTPATTGLIANAIVSGTITIEIAFLDLYGLDQFSLEKVVVFYAVRFGNSPYFRDFHSSSPLLFS